MSEEKKDSKPKKTVKKTTKAAKVKTPAKSTKKTKIEKKVVEVVETLANEVIENQTEESQVKEPTAEEFLKDFDWNLFEEGIETIKNESLENLITWIEADTNQQRGEFVLLIQGKEKEASTVDKEAEFILETLMQELPLKQASQLAAKITGIKKNTLYQIGLNKK